MSELRDTWSEYIAGFAEWTSFWSLTFADRDRTHDVTRSEAEFLWCRLVQSLNTDLFGNHYTRIVGHSYFSYALAFEFQKRGTLHMHALVDQKTNWQLANSIWRQMAGIIKIKPVSEVQGAARYLAKYVSKGGDVKMYRPKVYKIPAFKPLWYDGIGLQ